MIIDDIQAFAMSVPVENGIAFGIGRVKRRDTVVVRIRTKGGLVGYGEAHHARSAGSIAHLINHTLRPLLIGSDAAAVTDVWDRVYRLQIKTHGMGAAAVIALSGIDLALWDIRGKAVGWPLYKLLGGSNRPIPTYAGGVSLGWIDPTALVEEVAAAVAINYNAVKLRVGDTLAKDLSRVRTVRKAFGDDLTIMVDANTNYSLEQALAISPHLQELGVLWLEEPFAPHETASYAALAGRGVAVATGENHYTRFEFANLLDGQDIHIWQPDISKTGGITEMLRIAALGAARGRRISPHTSTTGLNMAATIHVLASIENGQYFEGDISEPNPYRTVFTSTPYEVGIGSTVRPSEKPGIGVEVDEDFIARHPVQDGLAYVLN